MRLEFNARAECYNLYCDTREEHEKLKLMMQQPITSIDSVIYADTDSVNTMKTKLNSVYGNVVTDMAKDYIVIHKEKKPMVIFKKAIMGVENDEDRAIIYCTGNIYFYVDEKYGDVIKQLV